MELVFRKYFWAVNLAFIALVAFFVARMANVFVEAALAPLPLGTASHAAKAAPVQAATHLDLARFAALMGLPLPPPEPLVKEPKDTVVDLNSAPVKSSLRVRLVGTLLASVTEWSIASIQDMAAPSQKVTTYMVHDKIQGAEVVDIQRDKVIVINNGRREFINGEAGDGLGAVAMAKPTEPGTQVTGTGIKAVDDNNYEVPKAEIDKTLANLNDVAMQARIVPAFTKDGKAQGFKLFSIRPDSIYTKIGIQNGDVIQRINGFDLNSPEKALEIYSKLKDSTRIDIDVDRNGTTMSKHYNVR